MKLKILSWNVAALPRLVNLFGNPADRIMGIIKYMENSDADLICLQEVFDKKILDMITKQMKKKYTLSFPKKKGKGYISSGLVVLSKRHILSSRFEIFKDSIGEDSMAEKGVLVTKLSKEDFPNEIFVLNTHLNADPMFTLSTLHPNVIRKSQLSVMSKLVKDKNALYIICADLNQSEKSNNFKTAIETLRKKFNVKVFVKDSQDYIIICYNDKTTLKTRKLVQPPYHKLSDHKPVLEEIDINVPKVASLEKA